MCLCGSNFFKQIENMGLDMAVKIKEWLRFAATASKWIDLWN
jgi:hypothetical protein